MGSMGRKHKVVKPLVNCNAGNEDGRQAGMM